MSENGNTTQDDVEQQIREVVIPLANKHGVVMVGNALKNILKHDLGLSDD